MNGTSVLSATSANIIDVVGSNKIYLGCWPASSGVTSFIGSLDEIRVSNIARYPVSGFVPYNSYFTPDANTMLLIHADDTTDAALRAPLSANGATVSTLTKFGTGSLGFSGNTYANTASSTNYYFGSNNFTTEFWFFSNTSNVQTLLTNPGVWSLNSGLTIPYVTPNLVAYWDMIINPAAGTTWTDISGNNNTITFSATPTYTYGAAYLGTTTSGTASSITENASFAIEFVIQPTITLASAGSTPIRWGASFNGACYMVQMGNYASPTNTIKLYTDQGGGQSVQDSTGVLTTGAFTHYVVNLSPTISGSNYPVTFYNNGVLATSSSAGFTVQLANGSRAFVVGDTGGGGLGGWIGMVRVYNYPLTAAQVAQNYASVKARGSVYNLP